MTVAIGRRKRAAACLTFALGVAALWASIWREKALEIPRLDGSTMTIVPGIHLLGGLGPAAAYAIETSDGIVLVDSGVDADAHSLKDEMTRLHLDWHTLRAILLTHVHADHCGGAESLRAATGATVYAGSADAPLLRAGSPREAFVSKFRMPGFEPRPTTVDVELAGGERLAFGAARVQVLGSPGHTPGSTCYLVEHDGVRVLFAGDVIQNLGDNPLGTYAAYLPPRYRGDALAFRETLAALRALPAPDLVLPGHPAASRGPSSPHLNARQWRQMLDEGINEMDQLVARYAADGASFLDGIPKRLLPELYYLGDFQGSAVYALCAGPRLFVVNAPGGAGLADFFEAGVRKLGVDLVQPAAILLTECGQTETGGLRELLERSRATVVVSPEGMERVKTWDLPAGAVVSAHDLPQRGWLDVRPIPLRGRGAAPTAYLMRWEGKTILFTGSIPAAAQPEPLEHLLKDLSESDRAPLEYLDSLRKLSELHPDLWLPAIPANGQNANLYDAAWPQLIEVNLRALDKLVRRP